MAERDYTTAYSLLSAEWRSRYTPERLGDEYDATPEAAQRLMRARAALAQEPRIEQGRAEYPVGETGAVRLVLEPGGWKVHALE